MDTIGVMKAGSLSQATATVLARTLPGDGTTARHWLGGLIGLGLLGLLLAGGFVWSYRESPAFVLDLGSRDADPYIDGFHAPERTPDGALTFRWTRDRATLLAPGFGRRDAVLTLMLAGAGRGDAPLPSVAVLIDGQPLATLATTTAVQPYRVAVPASLLTNGEARIELRTTDFRPPNDGRRLGVLVDAARLEAVPEAAPALPPWRLVLLAGLTVLITGVVGAATLARPAPALALAALLALSLVLLSRFDRYTLALWLPAGLPLMAATGLLALGAVSLGWWRSLPHLPIQRAREDNLRPAPSRPLATGDGRLATGVLWAVALANLLGVAHPQFRSSDLVMNVHRLEDVARGVWLFTLALPGRSALPAPYPPAYYAALLPWLPLAGDDGGAKQALVTHSSALLMTVLAGVAFAIGARVGGRAAGLWAAALHGFAPAGFLLVSQGNFANIFGQAMAGLALLALALLPDWRRPVAVLAIVGALVLAFLGHFGVFLSLLLAVPAMGLAVASLPASGRRQAVTLAALFALALLIAVLVYYRHYVGLIGEVVQRVVEARAAGDGETLGWHAGLSVEWGRTAQSLGWLGLPLAAAGLAGLWRGGQAGRVVVGWLAASALFAVAGLVLGLSVRYHFFALLGLAVAGGWALAWLGRRGRLGQAAALLLGAGWIGSGLAFWYTRILTYLH